MQFFEEKRRAGGQHAITNKQDAELGLFDGSIKTDDIKGPLRFLGDMRLRYGRPNCINSIAQERGGLEIKLRRSFFHASLKIANKIGILAFQEVRGIYSADVDALAVKRSGKAYVTNDFVGCGFAVSKKAYKATNGFPLWMDIYGEESAVAIEVLDASYEIIYDYNLIVNHRVDVEKRKSMGRNYFRFEHQLKNVISFYLVYYPKPALKIAKTLFHNFRKYAIKDITYFMSFMKVCGRTCIDFRKILKYRSPVNQHTIDHKNKLAPLKY